MGPTEQKISSFFDSESSAMIERHEKNGIPESARIQVQDIIHAGAKSVVDVGSGPGSVLIELLDQGVQSGVGIDLSPEMNRIARQRLKDRGYEERVQICEGSFLEQELETTEAISLHRVLCCHPNREGMLQQASRLRPQTISLTVPRDWKALRLLVGLYGLVARITGSFRPFIHPQKRIDQQLQAMDYQVQNRHKGLMWVTTTYQLPDPKHE